MTFGDLNFAAFPITQYGLHVLPILLSPFWWPSSEHPYHFIQYTLCSDIISQHIHATSYTNSRSSVLWGSDDGLFYCWLIIQTQRFGSCLCFHLQVLEKYITGKHLEMSSAASLYTLYQTSCKFLPSTCSLPPSNPFVKHRGRRLVRRHQTFPERVNQRNTELQAQSNGKHEDD